MTVRGEIASVHIGDLIIQADHADLNVSVVTELQPHLQAARILDTSSGEDGLCLSPPETVTDPIEVVGSIPFADVVMGFMRHRSRESIGVSEKTDRDRPEIRVADIIEVTKPHENQKLVLDIEKFVMREIFDDSPLEEFNLKILLDNLLNRTTIVAFDETGQILATGSVDSMAKQDHATILDVAVRFDATRRGLGTTIVHRLEEIARDKEAKKVYLTAVRGSKKFYESGALGYRQEGIYHVKDL